MTDQLIHDKNTDLYTITLDDQDGVQYVGNFKEYEIRRIFMVLVAHYCDCSPEFTTGFRGLVTGTDSDHAHERIIEWVGLPKSAQWRAQKLVKTGKLKGARAWLNILNTGIFINDWPGYIEDDEAEEPEEPEPEKEPEAPKKDDAQTLMDRWFD